MSEYSDKVFYFHGSFSFFSDDQRDEALKAHRARLTASLDDEIDIFVLGSSEQELSSEVIKDKIVIEMMDFVTKVIFSNPEEEDQSKEGTSLPHKTNSETDILYMKNGQELLDKLEEVFQLSDQWEDSFDWIDMGNNTHYDEDEPSSPVKTSWCQIEEYKDIWAIEVVTGGKSRGGEGWFSDDLEINSFELGWKWCDENGKWWGQYEEGGSTQDRDIAHMKFREWLKKEPKISEELESSGYTLSKINED